MRVPPSLRQFEKHPYDQKATGVATHANWTTIGSGAPACKRNLSPRKPSRTLSQVLQRRHRNFDWGHELHESYVTLIGRKSCIMEACLLPVNRLCHRPIARRRSGPNLPDRRLAWLSESAHRLVATAVSEALGGGGKLAVSSSLQARIRGRGDSSTPRGESLGPVDLQGQTMRQAACQTRRRRCQLIN